MKRRLLFTLLPLTVLLFFAAFAVVPVKGEGTGASVWTDKPNYTLGKTVTISGSGFNHSAQVTITIGTPDEGTDKRYAVTDNLGNFTYQYQLGGITGTYTVSATDGIHAANTAFTVKEPFYISIDGINGYSPPFPNLTNPVHLEGSASATDFPGELTNYSVQVDWGDGTRSANTSHVDFVQSGQDFSGTWSSYPDHTYAISGKWKITVKLYHGTPPGLAPGDAGASAWLQVEVGIIQIGIMINTTTSPTGLNLVVDSVQYTAPWTFEWIVGSTHSIGTTSPQLVDAGMRYNWARWSDNGAITHDIIVPSTSTTYTAYFTAQYYLTVESSHGTFSGEGWYDSGAGVYAALAAETVSGGIGVQYVFTGWDGDAYGTGLTSDPIIMDGPKTATANWKTQYLVSFDQTGSTGTPIVNYGIDTGSTTAGAVPFNVWVDFGQQISYAYEAIVSVDPGVRHPLVGVSLASPQTVTGPLTIIGTYKTQFKVTFDQTGIGTDFTGTVVTIDSAEYVLTIPLAEFWWDKGSAHDFAFRSPLVVDPIVKRYVLVNVDGLSPLVIMESMTVAGTYKTQYCLTLATSPFVSTLLAGAGWYDDSTYADISTTRYVDITAGSSRYRFTGWTTGDISEIGDSSSASTTVKMDKAKIVTANYIEQFKLTIATEPAAVSVSYITTSPSSGDGFYDLDTEVRLKAETPIAIDTGSQWRFDHWSQGASGNSPSTSVIMDKEKSVTANHVKQFNVKFDQTGVGSDYSGLIVTFDGTDYLLSELPQSFWLDEGDHSFEFHTPLEISDEKQYRWEETSGLTEAMSGTLSISHSGHLIGNYKTQFKVTFNQTGAGVDFTGTVLTIDSVDYVLAIPLAEFWWDKDSTHDFAFRSPLSVETDKQYVWTKTTGLSSSQSDTLTITGAGSVIGSYKTQWLQTFDASSNVKSDGTGTIVTVDDSPVLLSDLIFAIWIDDGLTVTFVYESIVSSTANCKQYSLTGVTGPLSGYKVSSSNTIFGNYVTQWLVTVELSGIEADFAGAIVRIDGSDYSSVPQLFWWDSGSTHTFEFQSALVVEPTAKRYVLVNVDHASPLVIMDSMTLSATYKTQYYLIVDSTHGVTGGQGWYDESDTARAVVRPLIVSGPEGIRYVFAEWSSDATGTTSPSDPITMNRAKTATVNWKTQYYLTVDSTYDTPTPMSGWFDADTEITASVTSPWPQDVTDTRYVCTGWWGTGSVPPTGTDTSVIFTVSGPSSITWNWKTQYYMTLETSPQGITTPCGAGWYDIGTYALVSTTQYVDIGADPSSYYRFSGWTTGDMNEIAEPSATSTTVFVDKAKIVTANYEIHYLIQYYLALETSPLGIYSPSGSGWYYEGNCAIISTAESIDIIPGLSRYRFVGWTTGDMNEIADPLETSTTVFVDKAKTVTANYVVQYAITFDQTGLSSSATGSVLIIDSTTKTFADLPYTEWVDSGKTVTYSYSNPVNSSILGEQFWLKSVSGLPSPFIVDKACTIIGKYLALPLSVITDSCLCYFDEDEKTDGQQFTLIFVQISANTYMLVVSNPWQVYYNVFYVGKPGDLVDLTVTIPYPFVTRGFVPVNVYSYVSIDHYGRFRPSGRVTSEFAITGPSTTPYGAAGISLGDYTGSFGSTVNIEVTGVVPSSGLVYVMVSLDYGLEWTWGYGVDSDGNAIVLRTNDLFIENGESYIFSYTVDDLTYMQMIESENVFIRFPWLIRIFADS